MRAVGADGCPGGWLAVEAGGGAAIFGELGALAAAYADALIVIDTPIGLPERWEDRRPTDGAARAFLTARNRDGWRSVTSRVFNAPPRPALGLFRAGAEHAAINRAAPEGHGVSIQAFNILRLIDEADRLVAELGQDRFLEGHPEIAFAEEAGSTLGPKKKSEGRIARAARLVERGFDPVALAASLGPKKGKWAEDDLLDACILAYVARRRLAGDARRLPEPPTRDGRGLRMEIWF